MSSRQDAREGFRTCRPHTARWKHITASLYEVENVLVASSPLLSKPSGDLPAGVLAVPLGVEQANTPLRLCVILCTPPPTGSKTPLIILREGLEGTEYLGCITDAAGRVLEWTVVTVQKPDAVLNTWRFGDTTLTNRMLDQRWVERETMARDRYGRQVVVTTWESTHPRPLLIDTAPVGPWHPIHGESAQPWVLCRDDHVLREAGLPAYSTSLARYLYLRDFSEGTPFVPVTPDSPANSRTLPPDEVFGSPSERLRFNSWAGFMSIRRLAPVSLNEYVDVLNGLPWSDICRFPGSLRAALPDCILMDAASRNLDRGRLFLTHHGIDVRLLEALYLKILVFQSALLAVRDAVETLERPLLNLTDESFDIAFGSDFSEIPFLWTAKAQLIDAGTATQIRLGEGEVSYANLTVKPAAPYTPLAAKTPFSGHGTVRVRRVDIQVDEAVIEGTLVTGTAAQDIGRHDVIRLRLNAEGKTFDLSARVDERAALAANEYRFRTIPLPLDAEAKRIVERIEGTRFPQVPYQVIPRLSTPCDLYSLGVLACRVLLQSPSRRLAEVLDEIQALSHQVGLEEGDEPISEKVARIMKRDKRWQEVLGPEWATLPDDEEADSHAIPEELWYDLLGLICRLFPEMGPHSICPTFGDVPGGSLYGIFDRAIAGFCAFGSRVRSMLLNDFSYNDEVRSVIEDVRTTLNEKDDDH